MADEKPDELTIRIDGKEYPFPSFDTIIYGEARAIKRHFKIVIGQFFNALEQGDPDALAAIAFIAKRRDDPKFNPEDLDGLKLDEIEIITPTAPEEDMSSPLDEPPSENDEQNNEESTSDGSESSPS